MEVKVITDLRNDLTPHPKPPRYCPKRTVIKINARIATICEAIVIRTNHRVEVGLAPTSLNIPLPITDRFSSMKYKVSFSTKINQAERALPFKNTRDMFDFLLDWIF